MSRVSWPRFLAFDALGAGLWVGVWTTIGYLSGSHIDTVYREVPRCEAYLGATVGALILAYISPTGSGKRHRTE